MANDAMLDSRFLDHEIRKMSELVRLDQILPGVLREIEKRMEKAKRLSLQDGEFADSTAVAARVEVRKDRALTTAARQSLT